MESLQARIKSTRITRGLSQAVLAEKAGVSQPTVANWENGSHVPRAAVLERIGEALGVNSIWLLSGTLGENETPAQFYMQHPIRHLPIYNWPETGSISTGIPPAGYVPYTTRKENLFGLMQIDEDSESYDIIICDPETSRVREGQYMIIKDNEITQVNEVEINTSRPETVLGRITAKMTFYR